MLDADNKLAKKTGASLLAVAPGPADRQRLRIPTYSGSSLEETRPHPDWAEPLSAKAVKLRVLDVTPATPVEARPGLLARLGFGWRRKSEPASEGQAGNPVTDEPPPEEPPLPNSHQGRTESHADMLLGHIGQLREDISLLRARAEEELSSMQQTGQADPIAAANDISDLRDAIEIMRRELASLQASSKRNALRQEWLNTVDTVSPAPASHHAPLHHFQPAAWQAIPAHHYPPHPQLYWHTIMPAGGFVASSMPVYPAYPGPMVLDQRRAEPPGYVPATSMPIDEVRQRLREFGDALRELSTARALGQL